MKIHNLKFYRIIRVCTVAQFQKKIQEPATFQLVVHDNTDTLELDKLEINSLFDFFDESQEHILDTYKNRYK